MPKVRARAKIAKGHTTNTKSNKVSENVEAKSTSRSSIPEVPLEVEQPLEEVKEALEDIKYPLEKVKKPLKKVKRPEEVKCPLEVVHHPLKEVKRPIEVKRPLDEVKRPLEDIQYPLASLKHPLENTWSFWMYTNEKKKWEENLVEMVSFDTVEDYWCLYHNMKTPSELNLGQDYAIFKKGIRPMWEDDANKKGGRWLITLEKRRGDMDWMWLDTVLLLIGENFESPHIICGVVVNVRAKCKISVWTADASKSKGSLQIGKILKHQLAINGRLGFQLHDSTKNLYTV